jgi:hypothetical protein
VGQDFKRTQRVATLLAGRTQCRLRGTSYQIHNPTRFARLVAAEAALEAQERAVEEGAPSQIEAQSMADWSEADQSRLTTGIARIDEFKVAIYQLYLKTNQQKTARQALAGTKKEVTKLIRKRDTYYSETPEGFAEAAKLRVLVGLSLHDRLGRPVWETAESIWESEDTLLEEAIQEFARLRLGDLEIRELARTEPWTSVWNAGVTAHGVFGVPSAELSEEQLALVSFAQLYDKVREHPDRPPESVIQDDDALDGWLILQRKDSQKKSEAKRAGEAVGSQHGQAGEVYVMVDSIEDATKVESLNDADAKRIKRQRQKYVEKHGEAEDWQLPDVQMEIQNKMMDSQKGR